MSTQIVELTGDEAALLKSLDKVIQKQLEMERKWRDTAEQGDAAGVALQDALARVQAESDKTLNGLLRELKTVGPEGSTAAAALRSHLQEAGKAGHRSMDDVLAQIRLIDPEAAAAAEQAAAAFAEAGEDVSVVWREQLQLLRSLGPEGSAVAAEIEQSMKAAAAEAAGGMEGVLAKLQEIDPTVAEAAAKVRTELAEAAQYSEREFAGVLDELRRLGPEGRQAATELRSHLVEAGKIAEKSMGDIAAKLEMIDPESAKAAKAIIANMQDAGKKGESIFASFGKSAVAEVLSIVTAYVGVQEAIQLVTGYLERQRDLLRETKETQLELAKSQQESAKNLAGLSVVERDDLLRNAVPQIAQATGFSDVSEITQALGAVASAGETNSDRIRQAVEQAARIERLTPERLDTTAAAASAVQRQSGLADIRAALALVETTGTQARIRDPQALVDTLPRAVGSLVSTVPQQNPEAAARQAAALFAQITQGGNDERGASSSTFAIDFGTRLQKFFEEMSDDQVKARSRIELIDRKIGKGTDTELDRQTKDRLTDFLEASKGVADPATLFGRLEVLQSSQALQRQFVGEGFGEKQFQTALSSLLQSNSDLSTALKQSFETIQANPAFFEREAQQLIDLTPQLGLAASQAASEAAKQARQISDTEGATLQRVREIVSDALSQASAGIISDALEFSKFGELQGSTAAEEALSGVQALRNRQALLAEDGISFADVGKINILQAEIENLSRLIANETARGALDPAGVDRARRRAEAITRGNDNPLAGAVFSDADRQTFAQMLQALQTIAGATGETANNTVPKASEPVSVTPALSGVVP